MWFETSLRDVNGNTVDRDEPFSTQVAKWLDDDNIEWLRINIDGVTLKLNKTRGGTLKDQGNNLYLIELIIVEIHGLGG